MKIFLNKKIFIILITSLAVLLFATLLLKASEANINNQYLSSKVCFKDKCIIAEVSDTPEKITKGLMFKTELAEKRGMLFKFGTDGVYPFWMKNTLIPLDVIWISRDLRIVHIENAVPCEETVCKTYNPDKIALYVLEVNSGFVEENNIKIGDKIRISSRLSI